jgi:hypothetical protein
MKMRGSVGCFRTRNGTRSGEPPACHQKLGAASSSAFAPIGPCRNWTLYSRLQRIRGKLRKLRNQARNLLKSFEEALRHDDVYLALVPRGPWESRLRNPQQRKELADHYRTEKVRADLVALIDWLDQSERKLSRGKSGPSAEDAQNVYLFVDSIDNVLDYYTNKGLTRSKRHRWMMKQIFAIVAHKGHKVGRGTIDTAMRQVIDASRSRRAGKLLLPGSRHYGSGTPE